MGGLPPPVGSQHLHSDGLGAVQQPLEPSPWAHLLLHTGGGAPGKMPTCSGAHEAQGRSSLSCKSWTSSCWNFLSCRIHLSLNGSVGEKASLHSAWPSFPQRA